MTAVTVSVSAKTLRVLGICNLGERAGSQTPADLFNFGGREGEGKGGGGVLWGFQSGSKQAYPGGHGDS